VISGATIRTETRINDHKSISSFGVNGRIVGLQRPTKLSGENRTYRRGFDESVRSAFVLGSAVLCPPVASYATVSLSYGKRKRHSPSRLPASSSYNNHPNNTTSTNPRTTPHPRKKHIMAEIRRKLVIVGDGACGKTCLLM
jgi:hypothetical protein